MGFLGVPLTQLSAILPAVFTSVGSAYGIHVLHRYRGELLQSDDNSVRVESVVRQVGPAVFMAGATTAAGFLSNAFSNIIRIREFGLFTAFGVLVALMVSTVMIPAILQLLSLRYRGWSRSVEQVNQPLWPDSPLGGTIPVVATIASSWWICRHRSASFDRGDRLHQFSPERKPHPQGL